jgi:acetyl-CoA carboxylase carboxyl transferase subunit alpha
MALDGFVLEFEKPIVELERKISEMKQMSESGDVDLADEIRSLEEKLAKMQTQVYAGLSRWQRVLLARHPKRPYTLDYVRMIGKNWVELHGDRGFADDRAAVTGLVTIGGRRMVLVGQQKGRDTRENLSRNFGMMHPEGYRKALRVMRLGARYGLPVLSLVDTPGAYPGIGAEERGQAEAIARNIREMGALPVPIIIVIIGEGASGGALGIGVGDRVLMFQNAWYSVISPEGCAAILWRDRAKAPDAAEALKLAADDLIKLDVIDRIVPEPPGGAHRDPEKMAKTLETVLDEEYSELEKLSTDELLERRLQKYRAMGVFEE